MSDWVPVIRNYLILSLTSKLSLLISNNDNFIYLIFLHFFIELRDFEDAKVVTNKEDEVLASEMVKYKSYLGRVTGHKKRQSVENVG